MKSLEEEQLAKRRTGPSPAGRTTEERHEAEAGAFEGPGRPLEVNRMLALQRAAGNAAVVQLLGEDEDEAERTSPVHDVVGKGGGQPIPESTRTKMESSFGQDFSQVRIHTGSQAAASAQSVAAQAYTVGDDIVFGSDSPSLSSSSGEHSLAHELAHVVQQRSGPVDGTPAPGGIQISDPSDRFETQAEQVANQVDAGPGPTEDLDADLADAGAGAFALQRQEEEEEAEEEP
jgi:hypothetical protein